MIWKPDLVSVIMPAHNASKTIKDSIESVRNQEFLNWELFVIEDGSTDDTFAIAQSLAANDERIKVLKTSRRGGPALARNEGLRQSVGKFVAFLDSDDLWHPSKLSRQLSHHQRCRAELSHTSYQIILGEGLKGSIIRALPNLNYSSLLKRNRIGTLTVVIDRSLTGPIFFPDDDRMELFEDYALWLNILRNGSIAKGFDEVLAFYRLSPNSLSSNKLRSISRVWRTYRAQTDLSLSKSAYLMSHYLVAGSLDYLNRQSLK